MKAIRGSWRLLSEDFSYWFQKGHWIWIMPNKTWWLNQTTKRRNTWIILNAVQQDREYPEEIEVNVLTRLNVQEDINGGIGLIWPLWSSPSADSWKQSSQTRHERISCFSVTSSCWGCCTLPIWCLTDIRAQTSINPRIIKLQIPPKSLAVI